MYYEITPEMASSILANNAPEYIVWADESPITQSELENEFRIYIAGDLRFMPKVSITHKKNDYWIEDIYLCGPETPIGVHFNRKVDTMQYTAFGILLKETNCDLNTYTDIQDLAGTEEPEASELEGVYSETYWVTNSRFPMPF